MAQHTIDLPCVKSAYVDRLAPDTNHSTETTIKVGEKDSNYTGRYVAIIGFNTSSVPAMKKIISIVYKLYSVKEAIFPAGATWLIVSERDEYTWEEATVTYNNYLGAQMFSSFGPSAGTIPANQYVNFQLSGNQVTATFVLKECKGDSVVSSVLAEFNSRRAAQNPPLMTVTYEDVPPDAPTPIDPIGDFVDNKTIIRFEWQYNSSAGGTQKAFDLQWSTDQTNWTTVSQTTANNYYDMPADTLTAGNIYWRVRCYNDYDEVGDYCATQSFYAVGAPAAPVINTVPTNSARPVVSWSAFGQQIYQLQVLSGTTVVYDSSNVPSISIRQHKVMAFLADGTYTVKLRIKNQYNLWSDWGEASVTITTVKPSKPLFSVVKTQYGIQLKATNFPTDYMLFYRNGVCINKVSNKLPVDNLVRNGKGEEGTNWWTYNNSTVESTLTFENGRFVFTTAAGKIVRQAVSVKPNTNYYLSGNVTGSDGTLRVYHADGVTVLKLNPGTFNTGSNTMVWVTVRNGSATTTYFDSVMLIEGTTAPSQYKTYNEAYIVDDNSVINGSSYTYTARAVVEGVNDVYNDSDSATETASFASSLISLVSDPTNIFVITKSLASQPKKNFSQDLANNRVYYAGRKNPVNEPSEHVNAVLAIAFYLGTYSEVEAFYELCNLKETVLYRDIRGRKIYGVLNDPSDNYESPEGYAVSCMLFQVDYDEELEV